MAPGPQHLVDGVQQTIAVLQHDLVELAPLRVVQLAGLQCLQVQPDRRDRCLELVGHGVDERVVLLVAADLAHEEDGVITIRPAMITKKKIVPKTISIPSRQFSTSQLMFRVTAAATRQMPRTVNVMAFRWRPEIMVYQDSGRRVIPA